MTDAEFYGAFDRGAALLLPELPRCIVLPVISRVWEHSLGRPWPGTWKLADGSTHCFPHGTVFTVNPDRGTREIIHDLSHVAYNYLTRQPMWWKQVKPIYTHQAVPMWWRWATPTYTYQAVVAPTKFIEYEDKLKQHRATQRTNHGPVHAALEAEMLAYLDELLWLPQWRRFMNSVAVTSDDT